MRGGTVRPGRWGRLGIAVLSLLACDNTARPAPPLGEVLLYIDTDLPVVSDEVSIPSLANRLRIDVYSPDASTWYESHDVDRSHAGDWPASFALALDEGEAGRTALVRLRAYASGHVRDYRGERYLERPMGSTLTTPISFTTPFATPTCGDCPHLVAADGANLTPRTEPLPALAIDQLVLVQVSPGAVGTVSVLLRGACAGTTADLYGERTCIDTDGVLEDVSPATVVADAAAPPGSAQGTFETRYAVPCSATPRTPTPGLLDDEACASGGVFVFGSYDQFGIGAADDVPQRVAALPPFLIDRYEVTVARWRAALAQGFRSPDATPTANEQPIPTNNTTPEDPSLCSWTLTRQDRETYALTCVSFAAASAFCRWAGGDLPTEAQWEYAASMASRPAKTRYPWGGDDDVTPTCSRAVVGRGVSTDSFADICNPDGGEGPLPGDARDKDGGDLSVGLHLVGLAGGVSEWMLDGFAPLGSGCWLGAPLESPACTTVASTTRTSRGGSWARDKFELVAATRRPWSATSSSTSLGFRCARPGTGS